MWKFCSTKLAILFSNFNLILVMKRFKLECTSQSSCEPSAPRFSHKLRELIRHRKPPSQSSRGRLEYHCEWSRCPSHRCSCHGRFQCECRTWSAICRRDDQPSIDCRGRGQWCPYQRFASDRAACRSRFFPSRQLWSGFLLGKLRSSLCGKSAKLALAQRLASLQGEFQPFDRINNEIIVERLFLQAYCNVKNSDVKVDGLSVVSRMQEIFCDEEQMSAGRSTRRSTPELNQRWVSAEIDAVSRRQTPHAMNYWCSTSASVQSILRLFSSPKMISLHITSRRDATNHVQQGQVILMILNIRLDSSDDERIGFNASSINSGHKGQRGQ